MLATLGDTIRDLGAVFAAIGAVVVTFGVLTRAKPVRWVFRKLVGDPLTAWHRAQTLYVVEAAVAPIHEQLKPNGGQSVRDRQDITEAKVDVLDAKIDVIEGLLRQQGIGDDIQP